MSYARPTLISQIVRKGRKVSINPRNEDKAAPVSVAGVSSEEELRAPFRSSDVARRFVKADSFSPRAVDAPPSPEIERRRSEKRNDSFWSKDDEKEGVREDSTRRALSPVGRRYKGETVSQFTNPDFRSRTSIRVFTLTAPISFLSISLLRDRRRKGRLASQTRSGRFAIRSPRGLLLENSYSHEFYRRDRTSRVVCIPLSPSAFLY
ncbi:hypothetical protein ALC60_08485 [Trachymyrmex zeteki]|uniref:Uncharacterized protein n=1 Tax=Mycetomoellerius zeteki TaxID=64791 RepID=A0A151WWZ7_9HYME|nr:hypothetical protein ALC60_08485 [Trachymyrmex zeteki]